jgi:DNA polymerase III epsilon subunit-like protein
MASILLDTETTGLPNTPTRFTYYSPSEFQHYNSSRIVQLAWVVLDKASNIVSERSLLIQPDGFTIENAEFHGITQQRAEAEGVPFVKAIAELVNDLSTCTAILAYNAEFDWHVLLAELHRYALQAAIDAVKRCRLECVMRKACRYLNQRKWPKLTALHYQFFGQHFHAHDALEDVRATHRCLRFMLAMENLRFQLTNANAVALTQAKAKKEQKTVAASSSSSAVAVTATVTSSPHINDDANTLDAGAEKKADDDNDHAIDELQNALKRQTI